MRIIAFTLRMSNGLGSRWRNVWYRALGMRIEGYVWLRSISVPRNWADITIEKDCGLDDHVVLLSSGPEKSGKLIIRSGTYINRFTMLDAHEKIEIGRNCMIGPHCYITDGDHGVATGGPVGKQPMNTRPVLIEDNVWLGAGVIVLKGVSIGNSAIVGAGSVVTRNVAPGERVAGVPAQKITSSSLQVESIPAFQRSK